MTHTPTPAGDGGGIDVDVDFPIDEFVQVLVEALSRLFFQPFKQIGRSVLEIIVNLMTYTPAVHPNPAVASVHHDLLIIAYAIFGVALMATGLLYMAGPIVGISYQQARMTVPRLFIAVLFATVAPQILQLAVAGTIALTEAVGPASFETGVIQLAGFGSGLILVWIIDATLLLAVAALFIIRDVYILFGAAISPLLAVAWAFPKARRYADTFIAGWFAALLIAPLDVLVIRFIVAMTDPALKFGFVPRWLLGIAGMTLLIIVPWQLYKASQAVVGPAFMLAVRGKKSASHRYNQWQNTDKEDIYQDKLEGRVSKNRSRRDNPYRDYTPPEGGGHR